MNEFKDIKEGDTVYETRTVRYGFNKNKYFYVPIKVIKITKTQFTCDNERRYQKYNGRMLGGSFGERVVYKSDKVFDQTKEMKDFRNQVMEINKAKDLIYLLEKNSSNIIPSIDIKIIEEFNIYAEKLLLKTIKDK